MRSQISQSILFLTLCLISFVAAASDKQPQHQGTSRSTTALKNEQALGQKKFQTHCGRCHNEPQQLSPAIAGTVLRHMRVRAMLSREDEQQILRYLTP